MPELKIVLYTLLGTGITFLATTLGAAMVFLFKDDVKEGTQKGFLGFAAGIMIAASVWSLLIPAIDMAEAQGKIGFIPAAGGFFLGGVFLFLLDRFMPHLHVISNEKEGLKSDFKRSTMIMLAVTLHNIPEGMAVGLSFSMAANNMSALAPAMALAFGMALQNLPEGAAISLPLKKEGFKNGKAFLFGTLSGIVEPIAGVLTAIVASSVISIMPWILSFAAGAMIYVVVEELIPEANEGTHSHIGTITAMCGFMIMMILDVALG